MPRFPGYSSFVLLPGEEIHKNIRHKTGLLGGNKYDLYLTNERVVKIQAVGGWSKTKIVKDIPLEKIQTVEHRIRPPNIILIICAIIAFVYNFLLTEDIWIGSIMCGALLPLILVTIAFYYRPRMIVINGGGLIFRVLQGLNAEAFMAFHDLLRMLQYEKWRYGDKVNDELGRYQDGR